MNKILTELVCWGLLLGLLAACSIGGATTSTGPTVNMGATNFLQSSVTLNVGDTLTLVDDTSSMHIITNGSWEGGTAHPAQEAGALSIHQTFYGRDTASIGPFTQAGTFHLYCTIHRGMNLTVIVHAPGKADGRRSR